MQTPTRDKHMANKTEFTDDMYSNLQEYYACDPEFCMDAAAEHMEKMEEKDLIDFYNEIFED